MIEATHNHKTVIDFFAGIGLVRYALERRGWNETFALDYSIAKHEMYRDHFGDGVYCVEDVHTINAARIPSALLAHASFPCTDTSVAGSRQGLAGPESSAFWGFIRILDEMRDSRPPLVLLENVEGFLTSNKGDDLKDALYTLNKLGYCVDVLLVNAVHFVPQSRTRLFIIGVQGVRSHDVLEQDIILAQKTEARPEKIKKFIKALPTINWFLNALPALPKREKNLESIIDSPYAPLNRVVWYTPDYDKR